MQSLAQWLAREKSGPKPRKQMKRSGRPKPVSSKRAKLNREYSVKRKAFLETHPTCQAIMRILSAGFEIPVHAGQTVSWQSTEIHHVRRRGKYLNDESTWLAISSLAHRWLHQHPKEARALGLLK